MDTQPKETRPITCLSIEVALRITADIAPVTTWDNADVVLWDYVGGETDRYFFERRTSAWDAARNRGAGQTFRSGVIRVALPVDIDPNQQSPGFVDAQLTGTAR